jgi:deoxyribose-phosphate aldolase
MPSYSETDIAKCIDHSVLLPNLTREEAASKIRDGARLNAASCCVRPSDVPLAAELLAGTGVLVCTVIGFPHGSAATSVKVAEAERALADGAVELDMVLNIGRLRSGEGEDDYVRDDVRAVVDVAHAKGAIVKVILENAYLTDAEKVRACRLCEAAGADFVKTSTGFAPTGSTSADLRLMRATCGPGVRVKAAGGIRTLDALLEALACGATRIGATATEAILAEVRARAVDGVLVWGGEGGGGGAAAAAGAGGGGGAPGANY